MMNEQRILNAIIGSTIVLLLAMIVFGGIPMWSIWTTHEKELAEYKQAKRLNRLAELTAKSKLRIAQTNLEKHKLEVQSDQLCSSIDTKE